VLVPLQCETLSHRGVGQLLETIDDVRAYTNPRLRVRGVVATMFDGRTRLAADVSGAEELRDARDAALALGDPETAAEAESWLGQLAWVRGDQAGCFAHLERGLTLLGDRPPSGPKALVLGLLARRYMTAADYGQAVHFGKAALALCTELADDEGRAESLNTIGTARASSGDRGGLADLDEAIAVSRLHELPRALARACLNKAVVLEIYGEEMSPIPELEVEGLAAAQKSGDAALIGSYRAREPMAAYFVGRWDEALRLCDEFIAAASETPHYEERLPRIIRAAIAAGRGEPEKAIRDCRRAIQLCRAVRDPQALYVTLGWAAAIFGDAGRVDESQSCAEEALGLWLDTGLAYPPAAWILGPAYVLSGSPLIADALAAARVSTLWLRAARAVATGEWTEAADLTATTRLRKSEADLRLRAAETLMAVGRRAEAADQLERALAFFWAAGATLYLHRADSVMAVSA
jgi:tetratricopeptide (TPR) repeat protein